MNYQLPITSARVSYEKLSKADAAPWTEFFIDNHQLHFVGIPEPGVPAEEAKRWVDRQLKRYMETGWGYLKMVHQDTGALIGHTGLIYRKIDGQELLEIGYSILPRYWGQGYATEASETIQKYMRTHGIKDRAISIIHFDNIGSQRVAEKNGMTRGREWEYMGMPVYIYEVVF